MDPSLVLPPRDGGPSPTTGSGGIPSRAIVCLRRPIVGATGSGF